MNSVFQGVLPIFLTAFLGSVIRRKWLTANEFWRGIEKLSFYILFPATLFESAMKLDLDSSREFFLLIIALSLSITIIAIALAIYQKRNPQEPTQFVCIFQGGIRHNNYVFFALGFALFGDPGFAVIATISPYLIVITNILAVISFSYYIPKEDMNLSVRKSLFLVFKSVSTNPFVLASATGIIFNHLQIIFNPAVEKTIHNLADAALPIGMMIVGASIKFKIKREHLKMIFLTSIFKLLIMPLLTFIILWLTGVSGVARSVGILFSCLPSATSSYILCRQLGGDHKVMSSIITFTTICSILSLSLFVYLLG